MGAERRAAAGAADGPGAEPERCGVAEQHDPVQQRAERRLQPGRLQRDRRGRTPSRTRCSASRRRRASSPTPPRRRALARTRAQANFANAAAAAQFAQNQGMAGFANAAQTQAFGQNQTNANLYNAAAQQQFQDQAYAQQLPINEFDALMSSGQVQAPTSTPAQTQVAPTNVEAAYAMQQQAPAGELPGATAELQLRPGRAVQPGSAAPKRTAHLRSPKMTNVRFQRPHAARPAMQDRPLLAAPARQPLGYSAGGYGQGLADALQGIQRGPPRTMPALGDEPLGRGALRNARAQQRGGSGAAAGGAGAGRRCAAGAGRASDAADGPAAAGGGAAGRPAQPGPGLAGMGGIRPVDPAAHPGLRLGRLRRHGG